MPFVQSQADGAAVISLYVQPKASRNEIVGIHDGALKLAVTSPPVDGQANVAVTRFLADTLSVAKKDVILMRGHSGRRKQFVVRGLSAETIRLMLNMTARKLDQLAP
ncbi:MAG: DUF167 family protein [Desulfobulbaceae bacterium]|jgi:uncharacterized protein (TIGR00251 family)|nr:DUF167 family protein [Desulfobulbaceae bacterium]